MDAQLMSIMSTLANEVDSFLAHNKLSDTKAALIRQCLRNAFEWILLTELEKAMLEINRANQLIWE